MIERAHSNLRITQIQQEANESYNNLQNGSISRKSAALVSKKQKQIEMIKDQFPSIDRKKNAEISLEESGCHSPPRYANRGNKTVANQKGGK